MMADMEHVEYISPEEEQLYTTVEVTTVAGEEPVTLASMKHDLYLADAESYHHEAMTAGYLSKNQSPRIITINVVAFLQTLIQAPFNSPDDETFTADLQKLSHLVGMSVMQLLHKHWALRHQVLQTQILALEREVQSDAETLVSLKVEERKADEVLKIRKDFEELRVAKMETLPRNPHEALLIDDMAPWCPVSNCLAHSEHYIAPPESSQPITMENPALEAIGMDTAFSILPANSLPGSYIVEEISGIPVLNEAGETISALNDVEKYIYQYDPADGEGSGQEAAIFHKQEPDDDSDEQSEAGVARNVLVPVSTPGVDGGKQMVCLGLTGPDLASFIKQETVTDETGIDTNNETPAGDSMKTSAGVSLPVPEAVSGVDSIPLVVVPSNKPHHRVVTLTTTQEPDIINMTVSGKSHVVLSRKDVPESIAPGTSILIKHGQIPPDSRTQSEVINSGDSRGEGTEPVAPPVEHSYSASKADKSRPKADKSRPKTPEFSPPKIPDKFCPICTEAYCEQKELLKHLDDTHRTERILFCPKCNRACRGPAVRLLEHIETQHKQCCCAVCDIECFTVDKLKAHMTSHTQVEIRAASADKDVGDNKTHVKQTESEITVPVKQAKKGRTVAVKQPKHEKTKGLRKTTKRKNYRGKRQLSVKESENRESETGQTTVLKVSDLVDTETDQETHLEADLNEDIADIPNTEDTTQNSDSGQTGSTSTKITTPDKYTPQKNVVIVIKPDVTDPQNVSILTIGGLDQRPVLQTKVKGDVKLLKGTSLLDALNNDKKTKEIDEDKLITKTNSDKPTTEENNENTPADNDSQTDTNNVKKPRKPQLRCKQCKKTFTEQDKLEVHVVEFHGDQPFTCLECGQTFLTATLRNNHMEVHQTNDTKSAATKIYKCSMCPACFLSVDVLHIHEKVHSNRPSHKCNICGTFFALQKNLDWHKAHKHKNTTGNKEAFKCPICEKMFWGKTCLETHTRSEHPGELPFECTVCGQRCLSYNTLYAHRRTHEGNKPHPCSTCGTAFTRKNDLMKHYKAVHLKVKEFMCETCGKAFTGKTSLARHGKTHQKPKEPGARPHKCKICGKGFAFTTSLRSHETTHTGVLSFICPRCGLSFQTDKELSKHEIVDHGIDKPLGCRQCGLVCKSVNQLSSHMMVHTGERPFKCEVCDHAFILKSNLRQHALKHGGKRNHCCSYCGKLFGRNSDLVTHVMIHTGRRPHVCTVCGKGFTEASKLTVHHRTHTHEKPYQCSVCGKCFSHLASCRHHMRIHRGEQPYTCEDCGRSFSQLGNYKRHQSRVHGGDRPYQCSQCDKRFSQLASVKKHISTVHLGQKPYECSECDRSFCQRGSYKHHMKTVHGVTAVGVAKPSDVDLNTMFTHLTQDMETE